MSERRVIFHVDMDAFFASVEQHDNPELVGKPVVVGGSGPRAVVAAASYEVRPFGVRSAMPMREALSRCPDAIQVQPRMSRYKETSKQVFDVFRRYTPVIQGLSLDEAFLDVTGSMGLFGPPETLAQRIKSEILEDTGLTASVGVAENKLVAKIASDMDKPDGLTIIDACNAAERLAPLDIAALPGVGPKTQARLRSAEIETLGQLAAAPGKTLDRIFGRYAKRMRERAAGIDDREVGTAARSHSMSSEVTFDVDISDARKLDRRIASMADELSADLRRKGKSGSVVNVKIRRGDFRTFTRQRAFSPPGNDSRVIRETARQLLAGWFDENPGAALRLIGVGVGDLIDADQLALFEVAEPEAPGHVDKTLDEIEQRFGRGAVKRGGHGLS